MNSVLEGARAGDTMSFFPLLTKTTSNPKTITPLVDGAVIQAFSREADPSIIQEAADFAAALHKQQAVYKNGANGLAAFAGGAYRTDVW
jgi:hypothetical protein